MFSSLFVFHTQYFCRILVCTLTSFICPAFKGYYLPQSCSYSSKSSAFFVVFMTVSSTIGTDTFLAIHTQYLVVTNAFCVTNEIMVYYKKLVFLFINEVLSLIISHLVLICLHFMQVRVDFIDSNGFLPSWSSHTSKYL